MSGVVLRCRTCGTTQDHPGECDTCSEGPVAYFCGNHSPGMWLEEPVCGACGARFGDAPAARPASTPRTAPAVPRRETPRRAPSPPARTRPSGAGVRRPPPAAPAPRPGSVTDPDEAPTTPSLADLLLEMAEEGRRAREGAEEVPPWAPAGPPPRTSVPIVGCLVRLVLFVLVLVLLALAGLSLLLSGVM